MRDKSLLFLSIRCISYTDTASGLFFWSKELLAFASRQFAPKIVALSVRFVRILFYIKTSGASPDAHLASAHARNYRGCTLGKSRP